MCNNSYYMKHWKVNIFIREAGNASLSVEVCLKTSSHMMLTSCKGSRLHSMHSTHLPNNNSKSMLFHKLQETLHS